jgi:C1A family cysteine protease
MKAVYALSLLAAAASALTFQTDPFWKAYKATYGKVYAHDREERRRYEIFTENMRRAAEYNAMDDLAEYGMTVVSDRFPEEIMMNLEGRVPEVKAEAPAAVDKEVTAPATFDARQKGWVPGVRNQGQCGSCWAFAVTGVMSINYAKKHGGSPLTLSEQQLVDCDKSSYGCSGGWPIVAATYAKNGVMLNSDYSYTARVGTCAFVASKARAYVSTTGEISKSVSAMKDAIYSNGAIVGLLNADKMQSYHGGIISASGCPAKTAHAIAIIGWGNSGSTPYWIVRNSWGSNWGESGYCRVVMNQNACGIETWPEYITVR